MYFPAGSSSTCPLIENFGPEDVFMSYTDLYAGFGNNVLHIPACPVGTECVAATDEYLALHK
jgi:hypothetical protein